MTLKEVAQRMQTEAQKKGYSHVTLERGLKLELWEREKDTVLGVSRPSALVCPSDLEIDICRRAFFGSSPLKVVNGETFSWSKRICFIAIEKEKNNVS